MISNSLSTRSKKDRSSHSGLTITHVYYHLAPQIMFQSRRAGCIKKPTCQHSEWTWFGSLGLWTRQKTAPNLSVANRRLNTDGIPRARGARTGCQTAMHVNDHDFLSTAQAFLSDWPRRKVVRRCPVTATATVAAVSRQVRCAACLRFGGAFVLEIQPNNS